ncbi:MAG: hypothetical protein WC942_00955 [Clostridia bacterium]
MNKYWQIFKINFKENLQSYVNTILSIVSFCIIIYIFVNLWGYIYTNGTPVINGYTYANMLWYLISAEIICYCSSGRYVVRGINNDVKTGKVAYTLNKPYNYYIYAVVSDMGEIIFKYIFIILAGLLMGLVFVGLPTFSLVMVLPIIFAFFLSSLMSSLLFAIVGLLAFWIEDATPFYWLVSKFFLILGIIFLPAFFPSWVQPIIIYSPVYSIYSGTSKLVANFSWELYANVTISQIVYIIIFALLGLWVLSKAVKKVNINGG